MPLTRAQVRALTLAPLWKASSLPVAHEVGPEALFAVSLAFGLALMVCTIRLYAKAQGRG